MLARVENGFGREPLMTTFLALLEGCSGKGLNSLFAFASLSYDATTWVPIQMDALAALAS